MRTIDQSECDDAEMGASMAEEGPDDWQLMKKQVADLYKIFASGGGVPLPTEVPNHELFTSLQFDFVQSSFLSQLKNFRISSFHNIMITTVYFWVNRLNV